MRSSLIYRQWLARVGTPDPVVTAPTQVGENFTLNSSYDSYQWKRNGSNISGATSSTYTATTGDLFKFISCTVNGTTTSEEVKFEDTSIISFLDPANTSTMFQETFTGGGGVTPSDADAEVVGGIYNLAPGGFYLATPTNSTKPTLGSGGGRNSFITGNTSILADNSGMMRRYLRFIHAVSPVWSVQFWVKVETDGTTKEYWFTKTTGGATTAGAHVRVTTTGAIFFRMGNGSATTLTYTTTATINAAAGWVPVYIYINGTGANASRIKVGSAAEEQFTAGAGAAVDAGNGFSWFGAGLSSGTFILRNRIPTAAEIADFATHNPARNSDEWISERWILDFNDTTKGFADSGETTPVSNGSAVRSWINSVTLPGSDIARKLIADSDAVGPSYVTSALNGKGAILFDAPAGAGRDAELDLKAFRFTEIGIDAAIHPEGGGRHYQIIVGRNRDATDGSHMIKTENYEAWTGHNYGPLPSDPGGPNQAYQVRHGTSGGSSGGIALANQSEGFQIGGHIRDGSNYVDYNGNLDTLSSTQSNAFGKGNTQLGSRMSSVTNVWAMDGNHCLVMAGAGNVSDTRMRAIMTVKKTLYAV